jgi:hypothetical protein
VRRRTPTTATEPRVTAEELADVLGWTTGAVISKLAHLKIRVGPDWADRPSVSVADAARVHERIVGDTQSHDQGWKSYQAYLQQREERRERQAAEAAAEARKGVAGSPQQQQRGQRAAAQAREQFDQDEPLQDFNEYRPGGVG